VLVVVADTGPLHYLVLIGRSDILPSLFDKITIPSAVRSELAHVEAPEAVRRWIDRAPSWLEIHPHFDDSFDSELDDLDEGERAALTLASSIRADLLLMDDRKGVRLARKKGLRAIGTLRVLQLAARRGLLVLAPCFDQLKRTNFRYRQEIMDILLGQMDE